VLSELVKTLVPLKEDMDRQREQKSVRSAALEPV
jgi:hypothetical protein